MAKKEKASRSQLILLATNTVLLLVAVGFLVSINMHLGAGTTAKVTGNTVVAGTGSGNPSAAAVVDHTDDDAFKGDADAPVTIVEWSDYQCPFCGRFYSDALPQIEEQYIKTGKVKLVYRDFPLSFHPQAQKAAEAAECAKDQDRFWDMHDRLFDNQASLSVGNFKVWAKELGLDTDAFNTCLDSGSKASEVQKDMLDGQKAGIRGTPGFMIDGKLVSGAQPFAVFASIIDEALAAS